MWHKHGKSAKRAESSAIYKSDHHFIFYCQDLLVCILFLSPQRSCGWYRHTVTAKWAFSLSVHARSVYLTTRGKTEWQFCCCMRSVPVMMLVLPPGRDCGWYCRAACERSCCPHPATQHAVHSFTPSQSKRLKHSSQSQCHREHFVGRWNCKKWHLLRLS